MVSTNGMINLHTKVFGKRIKSMGMESMSGQTVVDTTENGKIITCTVEESIPGKMVESMMVNI